jgi:hypothetical protein
MYEMIGQSREQRVKATVKRFVIKFCGDVHTFQHCAIAKSKKKNVPRIDMHKARSNEARISIEIVSVIGPSFG